MADETRDAEEPLLEHVIEDGDPDRQEDQGGDLRANFATLHLANTMVGAGIVALPKTFATLGLLLGGTLIAFVAWLSYFSLAGLTHAANVTKSRTFAELAGLFGPRGAAAQKVAIVFNNGGSMVIYLIIMGDLLVGVAPDYSGLITNLIGVHDPSVWYVSRPFVMAVASCVFLAPLLSLKSLKTLAPMSTASMVVAGTFMLTMFMLAVDAVATGRAADFRWLPSGKALGGSPGRMVINLLAVLPVILMAFVCQYNVLPIAQSLERSDERRVLMVIRRALGFSMGIFTGVAAGGYLVFGSGTHANILTNLSPEALEAFLPQSLALLVSSGIRLGYCLCLFSTFAMLNWALRETLALAAFGTLHLPRHTFLGLSYSILVVLYVISVVFPSVWTAMSLTGSTAAVYIAYILPGAIIAKVKSEDLRSVVLGRLCVVLGLVMGAAGVANTLFLSSS